jgi:O-acetyl-ADP-ribose deacetylase (regulator of RNase III)
LAETKHTLDKEGIDSLGLPAIGAGIGGLQLEKVKDVVRLVFNNWAGNVYFYQEYQANC